MASRKTEDSEYEAQTEKRKKRKREKSQHALSHGEAILDQGETVEPLDCETQIEKRQKRKREKLKDMSSLEIDGESRVDQNGKSGTTENRMKRKGEKSQEGIVDDGDLDQDGKMQATENKAVKENRKKKKRKKSEDLSSLEMGEQSILDQARKMDTPDSETQKENRKKRKREKLKDVTSLGKVDQGIVDQAGEDLGLPSEKAEVTKQEGPLEGVEVEEKTMKKKEKGKKKKAKISAGEPGNKKENALQYLHRWHKHLETWKFNKMLQVQLLHMIYDKSQVNDEDFEILLLYLEGLKGKARETTKDEAGKLVKGEEEGEKDNSPVDAEKEERARQVYQILS